MTPVRVLPLVLDLSGRGGVMHGEILGCNAVEPDPAYRGGRVPEVTLRHGGVDAYRIEQPGTAVGPDRGYAHLGHYLQEALVHRLQVVRFGGVGIHLDPACVHHVLHRREGQVRVHGVGPVSDEEGEVHDLPRLPGLDHQRGLETLPCGYEMLMHGGQRQERGHRSPLRGNPAV